RTGPTNIVPATGAQIGIAGIWLAYPNTQTMPPVAADFCSIVPGLRFAHPIGAPIQRCTLTIAGAPRVLQELAPLASRALIISPNGGLNPLGGDVLRVGNPSTNESDVVVTAGFAAVADPGAAVVVRLTAPTAFIHRAASAICDLVPGGFVAAG